MSIMEKIERALFGATKEEAAEQYAAAVRRMVDRRVEEIFVRALADDDDDEADAGAVVADRAH